VLIFYYYLSLETPWNHLWTPEEYKKENHAKHAEKYHMHPDDYKPYDAYERSTGDYPCLPMKGQALKDPYYPYDIPVYRKNYHHPVSLYIRVILIYFYVLYYFTSFSRYMIVSR